MTPWENDKLRLNYNSIPNLSSEIQTTISRLVTYYLSPCRRMCSSKLQHILTKLITLVPNTRILHLSEKDPWRKSVIILYSFPQSVPNCTKCYQFCFLSPSTVCPFFIFRYLVLSIFHQVNIRVHLFFMFSVSFSQFWGLNPVHLHWDTALAFAGLFVSLDKVLLSSKLSGLGLNLGLLQLPILLGLQVVSSWFHLLLMISIPFQSLTYTCERSSGWEYFPPSHSVTPTAYILANVWILWPVIDMWKIQSCWFIFTYLLPEMHSIIFHLSQMPIHEKKQNVVKWMLVPQYLGNVSSSLEDSYGAFDSPNIPSLKLPWLLMWGTIHFIVQLGTFLRVKRCYY